jgi:hypothetical protein
MSRNAETRIIQIAGDLTALIFDPLVVFGMEGMERAIVNAKLCEPWSGHAIIRTRD